jgi:2-oxoacid:acceptor oxidoreductase gamma subunit (pyruvate/2-ketoisovalerate family)
MGALDQQVEIGIYGRGGQGAKTAGELLTYALFAAGMKPHGQPRYTPDRMGAPSSYAIRFNADRSQCHDRSWIQDPQWVVLFDLTLLEQLVLERDWNEGVLIVANAKPEAPLLDRLKWFRHYRVDANRVARECGLMKGSVPILSSAMVGAFARATQLVSLDTLVQTVTAQARGTLERYLDVNLQALRRGYEEVTQIPQSGRPA